VILLTIAGLVLVGALSFAVIADVASKRSFRNLLLDTRLVLVAAAGFLLVGTLVILAVEYDNPATLGSAGFPASLLNAFFMAANRTSGFSSLGVGSMTEGSLLLLIVLMYVGGSSGSMAGGIKLNTFAVLAAAVISAMRGRTVAVAFGREIPQEYLFRALTVALLALALLFGLTVALTMLEPFPVLPLLFEATSAVAIVGLSMGITPDLSLAGKLLLVGAMYVGRVGPLTLALALAQRERQAPYRYPEGNIRIG
jgi:trk system potassium uptake protein TrkH